MERCEDVLRRRDATSSVAEDALGAADAGGGAGDAVGKPEVVEKVVRCSGRDGRVPLTNIDAAGGIDTLLGGGGGAGGREGGRTGSVGGAAGG